MPESVGTSQFTEMLDVQIKNTTFEAGLQTLEKAYDDFLNRLNKKGLSPQKVLDVNSIGQLNTQLSSLVSSFTEARNTIVESLGALSSATVEQLGKLSTAIEGKVRVSTRGATKDLNEMATAAEKVGNRFSKLSEMQAFQLYSQLKGSPEALAGLNWKEQKTFDRLNTRFSTSAARDDSDASKAADAEIKARQKADAAIKAINEKRDLELAKLRGKEAMEEDKKNAAIIASEQKAAAFRTRIEQNRDIELAKLRGVRIAAEQKSSELQTRIEQNRDMELQRIRWKSEADAERQAQSQVRLEQKASAERRRIIQSRDAWEAEQRGKRLAQEMKAQQSLNEFLAMSTSQQRRIALGGGWKGNGSLLDPSWQKEANALKSTLDGVSAAASPIERFFSKMSSRMPEFIAQIIKYSIGFQLVFAAINAIQAVLMAPINALKQGVTYLTAIQDRTADIKEALLENVKYSDNWVENTKKAAEASEIATRKIMEVAAAAAMPPEKIEAGLKALVQGGGLKLMNGNLEQSVELTAKLLSLMRARGISETNQRRAVTEINQLMTGQVKPASVLLQVLGVTTAEWKKIRTEAAKTHDLLGTHINATETVRDRLSAVDDRLANAQNRWKDLTATLEQYKNMLFGAFAEGIFRELLSLLQQIKRLFDENKDQLLEMARLTGESVGNFAKMLSIAGDVKNPLRALALIIGQMALSFESMVASGRYMLRFAGSPAMLVFRTLMNGGIPNKEILKNAAEDLKNNTIETATQFQDIKNRSAQLWTLYGSGKSALSMMDTGVAEIEKQQRLTKAILATAKARKLSNDEIAAYRTQLQNLNTLHKQFAARRDYVAAASGKQSPGILGYLDKPNEGDGVSGRLNLIPEFDKTFKDKVEVVKSEQQRLRQETEESVTEREVSVTQGTKAIVASYGDEYKAIHALVQKQKEELPSLRAQMVARGANAKQLAVFDQKVKEYLVTLSTYDTKANEEMQSGIHSQNQRATKDQQAITSQFIKNRIAAADQVADAEIDSYRRSYEDGFMLESAYLAKQLEVERTHHESNMAMLGLEKDAAGANSVARLQAEAAIAKEQAQWNKQQLDGIQRVTDAEFKEYYQRVQLASELRGQYVEGQISRIQSTEQRGQISSTQSEVRQKAVLQDLLRSYKEQYDAVLKASRAQGVTTAQSEKYREILLQLSSAADDAEEKLRNLADASAGSSFLKLITGKSEAHNDDETGAFDGFSNSVDTLSKGFDFFSQTVGNLISAWSQGSAQGGTLGGIGAVMSNVGGIVSMIPGGQIAGAVMNIAGGIASAIGSIFTAAARRIAEEIKKDLDNTMRDYSHKLINLSQAIQQVEAERADAIARLSGRKGGQKELDKLLPEIDDELYSLKEQQKSILDNLEKELSVLRAHSDALGEFVSSWDDLNQKVKEYIDAGGDLSKASEYMSLSIQKLRESYGDDLAEGEQQAIQDAITLNGLLQQRIDLVNEWNKTEFEARTASSVERQQSSSVKAAQELAQKYKDYKQQLDDLDEQISLTTKKVDKEREVFEISTDIAALHRRDDALQLESLDKEISKYKDLQELINNISKVNGSWTVSSFLLDSLGLSSSALSSLSSGVTVNGGINVTVTVDSSANAKSIGSSIAQSVYDELNRAYTSGIFYGE